MDEKGLKSPAVRRMLTIVLLLGISGAFIAFYYIVYLPQQQADFNQRMFRILHEITNNFSTRAGNYGSVSNNSFINKNYADKRIRFDSSYDENFDSLFKSSFLGINGNPDTLARFPSEQHFIHDSIIYEITDIKDTSKKIVARSQKALSDILEPLISIHANAFESVLLVKVLSDTIKKNYGNSRRYDAILYKSSGLDIANINTDSLFPYKSIQAAALSEIMIEGIKYKMFLMPFQMNVAPNETFVLAGIISLNNYNRQSQNIPLDFLITVVIILVFILLCLPFLKVFVLSNHENIGIADIRFMIASIFIIPFIITLLTSSAWLYFYPDRFTNTILSSLQNQVKANFYKEIRECIDQAKDYNSVIIKASDKIWEADRSGDTTSNSNPGNKKLREELRKIKDINSVNMKDIVFYPAHYRNIDNIHWIDNAGKDIASWRFTKDSASYFNLKDRQYFRDIKFKLGYKYPNSSDSFTIQATLSKFTGEYTLNTVIPSSVEIMRQKKSIATGISARMYSVYNTVVPPGFSYCLIDKQGDIIFHSDTARSLQGNLLEETANNPLLQNAITHKDSAFIDNVQLDDETVKMIINPFDTLPYYLVTYYNKRAEYLFMLHIEAFVFLTMSILLLFVSLFSYCIMVTNKRATKLLFTPGILTWLKPSADKKDYYIKNCIVQIVTVMLVFLFSVFLSPWQDQLYKLNYALLLPLFSVTGFYIVKRAKNVIDLDKRESQERGNQEKEDKIMEVQEEQNGEEIKIQLIGKKQLLPFLHEIKNILLIYGLSILIFAFLQDVFIYDKLCSDTGPVRLRIWSLIVLLPIVMGFIAGMNINYIRNAGKRLKNRINLPKHYLTPFIISLMLLVLTISVIPAITLTSYSLNEERMLHFQTFQLALAKKIQERRNVINPKFWQTKLDLFHDTANLFVNNLKFNPEKGLYLGGLSVDTGTVFPNNLPFDPKKISQSAMPDSDRSLSGADTCLIVGSPFYKILTRFLFLPPDHDEFYDNVGNRKFYYWENSRLNKTKESHQNKSIDSLYLYYNNLTDQKNPVSIVLGGKLPYFYLFKDITQGPFILLILLIIIFILLFYKIADSIAKRVFLIGYFSDSQTRDTDWLKQKYDPLVWDELNKTSCFTTVPESFAMLREQEYQLLNNENDECIIKIHLALLPLYERIWNDCTDEEKYTMYDFALDGFTNYKKIIILLQLYQKGLLMKEEDKFHLMTVSFRNFVLTKEKSETIKTLSKQGKGSFATMRTVFYVILMVVAVFIFLSQEEASKRLITIVTSMGALLPAILKLFDKTSFSSGTTKSS